MSIRRGALVQCESCGEDSFYLVRDVLDWMCTVCGGCSFIEQNEMIEDVKNG